MDPVGIQRTDYYFIGDDFVADYYLAPKFSAESEFWRDGFYKQSTKCALEQV